MPQMRNTEPEFKPLPELRRVVSKAPDDEFNMLTWRSAHFCGTARCAAGWAYDDQRFCRYTNIKRIFVAVGLTLEPAPDADRQLGETFGISAIDAIHLFAMNASEKIDPDAITREEVLANIDRLIAGQPALPYAAVLKEEANEKALADAEEEKARQRRLKRAQAARARRTAKRAADAQQLARALVEPVRAVVELPEYAYERVEVFDYDTDPLLVGST